MRIQLREMLMASMVLLIAPISILAQGPSPLEVSNPQVVYDVNYRFNFHTNSSTSARSPVTIIHPIGEVSAVFRNKGTKTIRSVTWEFLFFKDATETELLKMHTSRTKTMLLPGDSLRLRKLGYNLEPFLPIRKTTNTMNREALLNIAPYKKARVIKIQYADGTSWHDEKTRR